MKNSQMLCICYALAQVYDGIVTLLSLGYLNTCACRYVLCIDEEESTKPSIVWQSLKVIAKEPIKRSKHN